MIKAAFGWPFLINVAEEKAPFLYNMYQWCRYSGFSLLGPGFSLSLESKLVHLLSKTYMITL